MTRNTSTYHKPTDANSDELGLIDALRAEFGSYVVLHAHGSPAKAAEVARAHLGLPEAAEPFLREAVANTYFFNALGVAQALIAGHDAYQSLYFGMEADGGLYRPERPEADEPDFWEDHITISDDPDFGPVVEIEFTEVFEHTGIDRVPDDEGGDADDEHNPFVALDPEVFLGSAKVADLLGRGKTYIKDHAAELGGEKNSRGQYQFSPATLASVWHEHKG